MEYRRNGLSMNDITVSDLIEQLQKLPPEAIVVREDYDTSYIYGVGGFDDESLIRVKYVREICSEDPLIDYSRYEPDGDILCAVLHL